MPSASARCAIPRRGSARFLWIGAQRLERRHVDDSDLVGQRPAQPFLKQTVERRQKRRQRLARSGRRGNQRMATGSNRLPALPLSGRRLAECVGEPARDERMEEFTIHDEELGIGRTWELIHNSQFSIVNCGAAFHQHTIVQLRHCRLAVSPHPWPRVPCRVLVAGGADARLSGTTEFCPRASGDWSRPRRGPTRKASELDPFTCFRRSAGSRRAWFLEGLSVGGSVLAALVVVGFAPAVLLRCCG